MNTNSYPSNEHFKFDKATLLAQSNYLNVSLTAIVPVLIFDRFCQESNFCRFHPEKGAVMFDRDNFLEEARKYTLAKQKIAHPVWGKIQEIENSTINSLIIVGIILLIEVITIDSLRILLVITITMIVITFFLGITLYWTPLDARKISNVTRKSLSDIEIAFRNKSELNNILWPNKTEPSNTQPKIQIYLPNIFQRRQVVSNHLNFAIRLDNIALKNMFQK